MSVRDPSNVSSYELVFRKIFEELIIAGCMTKHPLDRIASIYHLSHCFGEVTRRIIFWNQRRLPGRVSCLPKYQISEFQISLQGTIVLRFESTAVEDTYY